MAEITLPAFRRSPWPPFGAAGVLTRAHGSCQLLVVRNHFLLAGRRHVDLRRTSSALCS